MKRIHVFQVIILIAITFLAGYWFGVNKVNLDWNNYKPQLSVVGKEPPSGIMNVDFSPFWTVWQKLQANYYDKTKLDEQKMLNGAIAGMVDALGDPFTMYLPPVQNTNFKQSLASSEFSGIGAELFTKDKQIIVISPLDGSPAEKVGILPEDIILAVDGNSTATWTLAQAVEKIRGKKGTEVKITVLHKGDSKPTELKIIRDTIQVKSVAMNLRSAVCANGVCKNVPKGLSCAEQGCINFVYIRLSKFGDDTNQEWANLVKGISDKLNSDKSIKGIVFDLRNNPGGYLTDAQYIASEFLPMGTKVVSEDNGTNQTELDVNRQGLFVNEKVVVLINKGSASASEIVSGSLRDNRQIKLVGETSFGKGTVQEAEDLGGGSGLHITIAKWLTPKGTWVHQKGLTPDVVVVNDAKDLFGNAQLDKAISELLK